MGDDTVATLRGTDELYPVIIIDGCTATVSDLQVTAKAGPENPGTETSSIEGSKTESSDTESSKTESSDTESSKTESSDTESSKTESSDTESSKTESSDTESSSSDVTTTVWDTMKSVGASDTVTKTENADGSVTLVAADKGKMGSNNAATGALVFGEATTGDITISAKVKVTEMPGTSNNHGIGFGVAKKDKAGISSTVSTYVAHRGKKAIRAISYVHKDKKTNNVITSYEDQFAAGSVSFTGITNDDKIDGDGKVAVPAEFTITVAKTDTKIDFTIVYNSKTYTKSYTIGKQTDTLINMVDNGKTENDENGISKKVYEASETPDELYPVIFIDGCTATISDLVVTTGEATQTQSDNTSTVSNLLPVQWLKSLFR